MKETKKATKRKNKTKKQEKKRTKRTKQRTRSTLGRPHLRAKPHLFSARRREIESAFKIYLSERFNDLWRYYWPYWLLQSTLSKSRLESKGLFGSSPAASFTNSKFGAEPNAINPGVTNKKLVIVSVQNMRSCGSWENRAPRNSGAGVGRNYRIMPPPSEGSYRFAPLLFSPAATSHRSPRRFPPRLTRIGPSAWPFLLVGLSATQMGWQPVPRKRNRELYSRTVFDRQSSHEKLADRAGSRSWGVWEAGGLPNRP